MRIEIFVVTTEIDEKTDSNLERLELNVVRTEIIHEFGGLTEIPNCLGYWENNFQIYTDNVKLWLIYTNSSDAREIIEAYAKRIKKLTYQKEQAFTIDGKLYLI